MSEPSGGGRVLFSTLGSTLTMLPIHSKMCVLGGPARVKSVIWLMREYSSVPVRAQSYGDDGLPDLGLHCGKA